MWPETVWWLLWKSVKHQEDGCRGCCEQICWHRWMEFTGQPLTHLHRALCRRTERFWFQMMERTGALSITEQKNYTWWRDAVLGLGHLSQNTKGKSGTHTKFNPSYRYSFASAVSVSGSTHVSAPAMRGAINKDSWAAQRRSANVSQRPLFCSFSTGDRGAHGRPWERDTLMHLQELICSEKATNQLKSDSTDHSWKPWPTQTCEKSH